LSRRGFESLAKISIDLKEKGMPKLYDKQSGALLGIVSDDDIDALIEQLEEEDSTDEDYFIDADTIDLLEEGGASETLISLLRKAVGDSDGIDVRYEE
jgi:hypothetical protein